MGLFSLSSLGGLLGNLASSAYSASLSRQNMEKQAELQKELWTYEQSNKHQLEVQDLRDAGLNPILSATSGSAVGNASVSGDSSGRSDFSGAMAQAVQAQASQTSAKAELLKAQTDKLRLDIEKESSASTIAVNDATRQKILADTSNIKQNGRLIEEQIKNTIQSRLNGIELTHAQVGQLRAAAYNLAAMVDVQSRLADAESLYKKTGSEFYKKQIEFFSKKSVQLRDEYDAEYLDSPFGKFLHQFSFGIKELLPASGTRVGPLRFGG